VALVDPRTLEELDVLAEEGLLLLAARIGEVRLIDNAVLTPSSATRPSQPRAREVLA
jgi:pantothenate synthetase